MSRSIPKLSSAIAEKQKENFIRAFIEQGQRFAPLYEEIYKLEAERLKLKVIAYRNAGFVVSMEINLEFVK